jgi:hypothetical protein
MEFSVRVDAFRMIPQWRIAASLAALAGIVIGSWQLRDSLVDVFILLLSCLPILLWLLFKREPLLVGRLTVDPAGHPAWQPDRPDAVSGEPEPVAVPVRLVRWHAGEVAVWLRVRRADGWHGDLFIDRARCEPAEWGSLKRWLTWVERGAG